MLEITAIIAIIVSLLITALALGSLIMAQNNGNKINMVSRLLSSRIDELVKASIDVGRVQERNGQIGAKQDGYHA